MESLLTKEPLACLTWNGPCHSHMSTAGYVGGGLGTPIWIPNLCLLQLWMCDLELARIAHYHPAFATTHRVSYSTEEEEEEEDSFRTVSVAAATSLKNTFLEIAMISLISEKAPRTDAIAMKKKMLSDLCLLLQQHFWKANF